MAIDAQTPRSRRTILVGLGGALGALGAQALARPFPVHAEGESIQVGGDYPTATSTTSIENSANNSTVFMARNLASGIGISGISSHFTGVYGSGGDYGIYGVSTEVGGVGVHGEGQTGVDAYSANGSAIRSSTLSGFALETIGRIKAVKISGVASIPAGSKTKTVTPGAGIDVTSETFVLLTPRNKLGGRDLWYTTNATDNTFKIHLSSARSSTTKVAWLLLG